MRWEVCFYKGLSCSRAMHVTASVPPPPPPPPRRYLGLEAVMAMAAGLFMRCPRDGCVQGVEKPEDEVHFTGPTCR